MEKRIKTIYKVCGRGKKFYTKKKELYLGRTNPTGSFLFVDSSSETLEVSMQSGVIIRAREVKRHLIQVGAGEEHYKTDSRT